jgi:hypothetical protein
MASRVFERLARIERELREQQEVLRVREAPWLRAMAERPAEPAAAPDPTPEPRVEPEPEEPA